jgi:DNA-binding SARP family transcriptional activator
LDHPLVICLLGDFRVLKGGREVSLRGAGKTATLLTLLALGDRHRVSQQTLLSSLWPDSEETRGAHALASMVHGLHQSFGDVLGGAPPVLHRAGAYELNTCAGVGVDTAHFNSLVGAAETHLRNGDTDAAITALASAAQFYRGDVYVQDDLRAVVERERLRAVHLSLLSRLADAHFRRKEYKEALHYAGRLLAADPCREDAHRLVMRCHVRLGERAQGLRQFRICEEILQSEYGAPPEGLTRALFERICSDPGGV